MSIELERLIGPKHITKGIAVIPYNDALKYKNPLQEKVLDEIFPVENSKLKYYYGGKNNLPDIQSLEATKKIFEMCSNLNSSDLLITLISGGGSALLTYPENIKDKSDDSVADGNFDLKLKTIKKVVQAGATINELNIVRSCLSLVKGGKLALCSHPAQVISLVISDVIDDPLEIISSGPCCVELVNSENIQALKALDVLTKYELVNQVPNEVVNFLKNKSLKEKDNKIDVFLNNHKVFNYLIGNNKFATLAIFNESENNLNYDYKKILTNSLSGEAKLIGSLFGVLAFAIISIKKNPITFENKNEITNNILESIEKMIQNENFILKSKDFKTINELLKSFLDNILQDDYFLANEKENSKSCFITGGETTVTLTDIIGKGGRNQELTLAFEIMFQQLVFNSAIKNDYPFIELLFSSFGSDGIDGPTDAAGAYFMYDSRENHFNNHFDEMYNCLINHDSYNYLNKHDRLIRIGPTGTNVSDLQVLLINF